MTTERRDRPVMTGADPETFRYQVQGPDAVAVMEQAVDGDLPNLDFFAFEHVAIDGVETNLLRHGMAGEPGFEFWGPYEHRERVTDAVLAAGEACDLRRLGSKAYQSVTVVSGWLPIPIRAIYTGEAMADFREWLDLGEGMLSLGGSYGSEDIEDYYVTPVEAGYGRLVDFDHDFVGKEALREEMKEPAREKVTLVWDDEDVIDVYGSLFDEGPTKKYVDLPVPVSSATQYDELLADGEHVGVSKWASYVYNQREMLSLALVDTAYSDPGTELTLRWGEATGAANPQVEAHELTDVSVTVAPAPYTEDHR